MEQLADTAAELNALLAPESRLRTELELPELEVGADGEEAPAFSEQVTHLSEESENTLLARLLREERDGQSSCSGSKEESENGEAVEERSGMARLRGSR